MKISNIKLGILFIFVIIILIELGLFLTNKTVVLGKTSINNEVETNIKIEEESANLTEEEAETLKLINQYRKQNGLNELKALSTLQNIAKLKAEDLENNEYFSHTSKNLRNTF